MGYKLLLKEFRRKSGLTQQEVAERAHVSLSTYRSWEQGVAKKFSLENASLISEIIGCTPNDLCGWYDDHPRESAQEPLPPEEAELMRNYRSCTPQWRANISMTARAAAGEAREEAERDVSGSERVTKTA